MSSKEKSLLENKLDIKKPKLYNVIMHNDDYTTMDFVVDVLVRIFHKSNSEATSLMLHIHQKGSAVAGTYVYDIALTKKITVEKLAAKYEYPLKLTVSEVFE